MCLQCVKYNADSCRRRTSRAKCQRCIIIHLNCDGLPYNGNLLRGYKLVDGVPVKTEPGTDKKNSAADKKTRASPKLIHAPGGTMKVLPSKATSTSSEYRSSVILGASADKIVEGLNTRGIARQAESEMLVNSLRLFSRPPTNDINVIMSRIDEVFDLDGGPSSHLSGMSLEGLRMTLSTAETRLESTAGEILNIVAERRHQAAVIADMRAEIARREDSDPEPESTLSAADRRSVAEQVDDGDEVMEQE